jgi:hypothetical protein
MTTWIDQQTDAAKLAAPTRVTAVAAAIVLAEELLVGVRVDRDIVPNKDFPLRLMAYPSKDVPYGQIWELDR